MDDNRYLEKIAKSLMELGLSAGQRERAIDHIRHARVLKETLKSDYKGLVSTQGFGNPRQVVRYLRDGAYKDGSGNTTLRRSLPKVDISHLGNNTDAVNLFRYPKTKISDIRGQLSNLTKK